MAEGELVALQVAPEVPRSEASATKTDMILAPTRSADRLRHFPEEVYDLSAESHLTRFLKVLIGDAGAGQLRKRLLFQRMQSTLQGSHFYDLDRFYGPLFGVRRTVEEVLGFDPYTQNATTGQWDDALAKDASFRSRIEQFSRALSYGPTPTGMELIAEALLAVDCDVYESYIQADESYQTYAELENQYGAGTPGGTLADMEGVSYGSLEGQGLARMSGNERRVFTIRPKRRISMSEARDLRRVLNRIKPADTRFIIDYTGISLHEPLPIGNAVADSDHWEVVSQVTAPPAPLNPYPVPSVEPAEQPRPPFTGYQGEAWSYNADLTGAVAYNRSEDKIIGSIPTQRVTYADRSVQDFPPQQAVLPQRVVQAGRVVSDGILVSHPYPSPRGVPSLYQDRYVVPRSGRDIAPLYADGIPLDALNNLLKNQSTLDPYQQNPEHRYWVTTERYMTDGTEEVLEVRLTGDRRINYVSFEVSRFPHEAIVEVYETLSAKWTEVHRQSFYDSVPRTLSVESPRRGEHPHHSHPGHWEKVSVRTPQVTGSRMRVRLKRIIGNPPQMPARRLNFREPIKIEPTPYSLALRSLDLGYRVTSREDFSFIDPDGDGIIASTRDIAGSLVQFRLHQHRAENLLTDTGYWRSEPQPVNYAVVNLYLDTRGGGNGDGTVIDRFYLDPTHVGAHFSIYYSNDPEDSDDSEAFFEQRRWTPIPRDYTLQKGYVHLPPTRARYWKFEFTNLAAEPYEALLPITRKVRLFPRALVEGSNYGEVAADVPGEMVPAINVARESRYIDAVETLVTGQAPQTYRDTDALYFPNPNLQERLRDESWVFGFTPWHQGDHAPRFNYEGRHIYETAEVRHTTKVAFFVGLRSIEAYRTKWEADDDTQVYFDTFDDFRNLTPGFTWTFEPGHLTSGSLPQNAVEATSRTFLSLHNVEAVQFATEQTEPVQLIPDDDFKDPRLATYRWDNPDDYRRVGDAQLIYSTSDHSVLTLRYVIPPPRALDRTGGIVQETVQPVFAERPYEFADEGAVENAEGGIESPLVGLSPEGRVYAAVRFTLDSDLTSPLYLQIVDQSDGSLLIEKALTGRRGETVEGYMGYDIPRPEMAVRVRLIQRGKSSDAWRLDTLSLFEDAIIWEFSVNGGGNWYPANAVKNNDNGVLTFPEVGNQLRYRVRTHRPYQWVSAIKIRPWYVGTQNVRPGGTHRGPNLSVYDQDTPIHEDPMFTAWKKPIPYGWFAASRRYPLLPVEDIPNVGEFSRFYGRPIADSVTGVSDGVSHLVIQRRSAEERLDFMHPSGDAAARLASFFRNASTAATVSGDAADPLHILGINKPITSSIVKPVFSERNFNE